MSTRPSSSDISATNFGVRLTSEAISDEDLLRGFTLALGASGRVEKTLRTYGDSVRLLSDFAKSLGLQGLAEMDRTVVRHWLMSLHQKGHKPGGIHVRYRSVNRFFRWCVSEGERVDNPCDQIDPPRIPEEIQPHYSPEEVQKVLKAIGRKTIHNLRDQAFVVTLYDTGCRGAELAGVRVEDIDWRALTILVTGKAGKQRRVSIGHTAAAAIERYLRKRKVDSLWLWLASGNQPLKLNGLRMMLERRFKDAGVPFRGVHAFRRGFAMEYLGAGGSIDDLKELAGWSSYAMATRYAKASAGERAVKALKRFSPGDRLNAG